MDDLPHPGKPEFQTNVGGCRLLRLQPRLPLWACKDDMQVFLAFIIIIQHESITAFHDSSGLPEYFLSFFRLLHILRDYFNVFHG